MIYWWSAAFDNVELKEVGKRLSMTEVAGTGDLWQERDMEVKAVEISWKTGRQLV